MLVDFYQLGGRPPEDVLPRLCERLLGSGERLLVVAGAALLTRLDERLWSWSPGSFLPHARASDPSAARQPILLSEEPLALNGAANIALTNGVWRDEAFGFARAFYLFGAEGIAGARECWRALAGRDGVEKSYWKQDARGKWERGP